MDFRWFIRVFGPLFSRFRRRFVPSKSQREKNVSRRDEEEEEGGEVNESGGVGSDGGSLNREDEDKSLEDEGKEGGKGPTSQLKKDRRGKKEN